MYGTPAKFDILLPITVPKMNKYNAAEIVGATSV
jgi:hypothetical protein